MRFRGTHVISWSLLGLGLASEADQAGPKGWSLSKVLYSSTTGLCLRRSPREAPICPGLCQRREAGCRRHPMREKWTAPGRGLQRTHRGLSGLFCLQPNVTPLVSSRCITGDLLYLEHQHRCCVHVCWISLPALPRRWKCFQSLGFPCSANHGEI